MFNIFLFDITDPHLHMKCMNYAHSNSMGLSVYSGMEYDEAILQPVRRVTKMSNIHIKNPERKLCESLCLSLEVLYGIKVFSSVPCE